MMRILWETAETRLACHLFVVVPCGVAKREGSNPAMSSPQNERRHIPATEDRTE